MTNEELLSLLDFEQDLQTVDIINEEQLENDAYLVVAKLNFRDDTMTVPFVYYTGKDWIFAPWDWQGWLPSTREEIAEINWRVDDTEIEGVIFNGQPILATWIPEEPNPKRATRKRLGLLLKEAREEKGISIRSLADSCGINKSQVCRVEAGRLNVGIDTLSAMADALGLDITLESK